MGLFKHFAFSESRAFEFRAEGYNVFNHTQWNGINGGTSCFGDPGISLRAMRVASPTTTSCAPAARITRASCSSG